MILYIVIGDGTPTAAASFFEVSYRRCCPTSSRTRSACRTSKCWSRSRPVSRASTKGPRLPIQRQPCARTGGHDQTSSCTSGTCRLLPAWTRRVPPKGWTVEILPRQMVIHRRHVSHLGSGARCLARTSAPARGYRLGPRSRAPDPAEKPERVPAERDPGEHVSRDDESEVLHYGATSSAGIGAAMRGERASIATRSSRRPTRSRSVTR